MQGRYGTSISTEIRSSRWLIPFPASALLAVHVLTPAPSVRSAWRTRLWSMLVPASIAAPARAFARPVQSTLNKQFCTPCAALCGPRFFVGWLFLFLLCSCSFFAKKEPKKLSPGQKIGVARRGSLVCPSEAFRRGQDPALQIPGARGSWVWTPRVLRGSGGKPIPGQKVKISLLLSLSKKEEEGR